MDPANSDARRRDLEMPTQKSKGEFYHEGHLSLSHSSNKNVMLYFVIIRGHVSSFLEIMS